MGNVLTAQQIGFFKSFGYLAMRQVLRPDELAAIGREFESAMAWQHPEGYDRTKRHNAVLMDEDTPTFAALREDERFLRPASQLYGEDVLGVCVDGNRYVGDTGWHPDSSTPFQYGVKFCIYLQSVGERTGALRVIPSSYRSCPWTPEFQDTIYGMPLAEVPAVAIPSEPGDIVAFDFRTWHASLGGAADRRMCTLCYYANPKTQEERDEMRRRGEQNIEALKIAGVGSPRPYLYSARWMSNPGHSPHRRRWIERLSELGYFAPGLVEGAAQPV